MSATGDAVSGAAALSKDHLKSWAVTGLPLWNFALARSLKVYTVPSSMVQLSAMSGTSLRSVSRVTRPLNTSTTTPAEVVSPVR